MLGEIQELAIQFVTVYGLPVVFIVFFLEGAIVGKLLPTRALLVITVVFLGAELATLLTLLVTATIGATLGQSLLFLLIRSDRTGRLDHRTILPINDRWLTRTHTWFDRWGLPALLVSNALPVGRGYLAIPVALSPTPGYQFLLVSIAGTALYIGALILAATGITAGIHTIDPHLLTLPG